MWYVFVFDSRVAWIIEADDIIDAETIGYENGMDAPLYHYGVDLGVTNFASIYGDPDAVIPLWKEKYGKYAQGDPESSATALSESSHKVYAIGRVRFDTIEDYACCRTSTDEVNEYNAIEVIYKNGNIRFFSNGCEEMVMIRTYHDKGIDTTAWEMLLTEEQG